MPKPGKKQPQEERSSHKQSYIQVRLDKDLAAKLTSQSQKYGGASVVIRALIRRWLIDESLISPEDALAEIRRAPRRRKPPK